MVLDINEVGALHTNSKTLLQSGEGAWKKQAEEAGTLSWREL